MKLHTLGQLQLTHSDFNQMKSLLLLAHLTVEGSKARRVLASLFWPEASNPLNNLAVAVFKMRQAGLLDADEVRVWSLVGSDVQDLRQALQAREWDKALQVYQGMFLDGVKLSGCSEELEEWVFHTREQLAGEMVLVLLELAQKEAAQMQFLEAGRWAAQAFQLQGAPPLALETLRRLHGLLLGANHPLAEKTHQELQEWGVQIHLTPEQARAQFQPDGVGRENELHKLLALQPGAWAWVRGGMGMGKTTLLKWVAQRKGWMHLQGRQGSPYATLKPLLGEGPFSEVQMLHRLQDCSFVLDDWHLADPESQALMCKLQQLHPSNPLVISSMDRPAMPVHTYFSLKTLSPEDLQDHPGAFDATQGLPALVGAWLRKEPLLDALEARLMKLPESARLVLYTTGLMAAPDYSLIRTALGMDAETFSWNLQLLQDAGWLNAHGHSSVPALIKSHLDAQVHLKARLTLQLARHLPEMEALPHYRDTRPFWDEKDLARITRAYSAFAREILLKGFAQQAADLLKEAPETLEIRMLRARSLEQAGAAQEALDLLEPLGDAPQVCGLRGLLLWRLGQAEAAEQSALAALKGDLESKADGLSTLGNIMFARGNFQEADQHFRRSATYWKVVGETSRHLAILRNSATARFRSGEDPEQAFQEVLEATQDHPVLLARTYLNLGNAFEQRRQTASAQNAYLKAIELSQQIQDIATESYAWNNLGMLHHKGHHLREAEHAYQRALEGARQTRDPLITAVALGNLAELLSDPLMWQDAIDMLHEAGHTAKAQQMTEHMTAYCLEHNIPIHGKLKPDHIN